MQRRGKGRGERKVRQNKDYPTSVIAAGCICRWTVMLHTVLEIPAAGKGSPSIHLSVRPLSRPLSRPFPSWPTHCRALESPSKALDWTVLQCLVQIPARSKSSMTISTQSGLSLCFLRLFALTSMGGSLLRSCVSYWVFSTSGWAKVLSRQGTSLLVILLPWQLVLILSCKYSWPSTKRCERFKKKKKKPVQSRKTKNTITKTTWSKNL